MIIVEKGEGRKGGVMCSMIDFIGGCVMLLEMSGLINCFSFKCRDERVEI